MSHNPPTASTRVPAGSGRLADQHAADPRQPATLLFMVLFTLATFGVWMAINLPATVTLALRVSAVSPHNAATAYSFAAGIGTLFATIANPLFGRLSDRTRSRWGRRKPWIVVGLAGTSAGALLIGFTGSLPLLIVGWAFMQFFVNATVAGLLAYIADAFPERQHGLLGSIQGATFTGSLIVGIFFVAWFPNQILPQIGLPMLLAIVFTLLLLPQMRHEDTRGMRVGRFGVVDFLGSFALNPRKSPNFAWFVLSLFLLEVSTVGLSTYHVYYMQGPIGITAAELSNALIVWSLLNSIASVIFAPLSGWLADRTGRPKLFFVAAAVLGAASVVFIVDASSFTTFLIGTTIAGVSVGILQGTYYVFATSTMNDPNTIARDLGVTNIAVALPFSIVPLLAPLVLGIGEGAPNYQLLFILGGVVGVLGVVPLWFIRNNRRTLAEELAEGAGPAAASATAAG